MRIIAERIRKKSSQLIRTKTTKYMVRSIFNLIEHSNKFNISVSNSIVLDYFLDQIFWTGMFFSRQNLLHLLRIMFTP